MFIYVPKILNYCIWTTAIISARWIVSHRPGNKYVMHPFSFVSPMTGLWGADERYRHISILGENKGRNKTNRNTRIEISNSVRPTSFMLSISGETLKSEEKRWIPSTENHGCDYLWEDKEKQAVYKKDMHKLISSFGPGRYFIYAALVVLDTFLTIKGIVNQGKTCISTTKA